MILSDFTKTVYLKPDRQLIYDRHMELQHQWQRIRACFI